MHHSWSPRLWTPAGGAETPLVTALTVGVTTAKHPECKRGVATNVAAALSRHSAVSARVCLVDADPLTLDVTTRLAVAGPVLEDFARPSPPPIGRLGHLTSPMMSVLPCGGGPIGKVRLAMERALPELRAGFDVVVCDLPVGPTGPGLAVGGRLDLLDWLVLAVTPTPTAVAAASHFLEHFRTAQDRGDVGGVQLAVVCTGDESSADLHHQEIESMLGVVVTARVPQLWGRAEPNLGFGPALAIPEVDDAVYDLFVSLRSDRDHRRALLHR